MGRWDETERRETPVDLREIAEPGTEARVSQPSPESEVPTLVRRHALSPEDAWGSLRGTVQRPGLWTGGAQSCAGATAFRDLFSARGWRQTPELRVTRDGRSVGARPKAGDLVQTRFSQVWITWEVMGERELRFVSACWAEGEG